MTLEEHCYYKTEKVLVKRLVFRPSSTSFLLLQRSGDSGVHVIRNKYVRRVPLTTSLGLEELGVIEDTFRLGGRLLVPSAGFNVIPPSREIDP